MGALRPPSPGPVRLCGALALALAHAAVSGASAQVAGGVTAQDPAAILTTVDPCVPVDAEQFHRVLSIELGTSIEYSAAAPAEVGRTWVHVSCSAQGIELRLDDGITRKSMVRVLDATRIEPASRTRLVALAVAEFVVASWVELRIHERPAVEPVGPAPSPQAREAAERAVSARAPAGTPARSRPSPATWELSGLFRLEGWSSQLGLVPTFALRFGQRPVGHFAFVVGGDFGTTRATVPQGQVQLTLGSALGALFFATRVGALELYAGGGGRFGVVRLQGNADNQRVRGTAFDAPYGGPLVMGRFAYHVTPSLRLVTELEAGIVTLPVTGLSGKTTVLELDGAWLSGALGIGAAF